MSESTELYADQARRAARDESVKNDVGAQNWHADPWNVPELSPGHRTRRTATHASFARSGRKRPSWSVARGSRKDSATQIWQFRTNQGILSRVQGASFHRDF